MIYRFNIPIPDFPRINYMLGVALGLHLYEDVSVMIVILKVCFINVGYKGVCITLRWQHYGSAY